MLLDDAKLRAIEPAYEMRGQLEKLYDFELMQGGGRLRGWKIDGEMKDKIDAAFDEIQQESGGSIPRYTLAVIAESYGIKESFVLAVVKRIPSLRLQDTHLLQLCAGPNCGKRTELAALAEKLCKANPKVTLKFTQCMRMCGKGPNLRWDGKLYNGADDALLRRLAEEAKKT
jgi:NADH:ubiquinone oxidoreductase subunit E